MAKSRSRRVIGQDGEVTVGDFSRGVGVSACEIASRSVAEGLASLCCGLSDHRRSSILNTTLPLCIAPETAVQEVGGATARYCCPHSRFMQPLAAGSPRGTTNNVRRSSRDKDLTNFSKISRLSAAGPSYNQLTTPFPPLTLVAPSITPVSHWAIVRRGSH